MGGAEKMETGSRIRGVGTGVGGGQTGVGVGRDEVESIEEIARGLGR